MRGQVCSKCHARPVAAESTAQCVRCLARQRRFQRTPAWKGWYAEWRRKRRAIARARGECIICFKRPVAPGLTSKCRVCVRRNAERNIVRNRAAFRVLTSALGGACAECGGRRRDSFCVIGRTSLPPGYQMRYVRRLKQLRRHAKLSLLCGSCWMARRRENGRWVEQGCAQ